LIPVKPGDRVKADRRHAREDPLRARHRLSKLLLRRAWVYGGGKKAWTVAHRHWLRSLQLEHRADRMVFEDHLLAVDQVEERVQKPGRSSVEAAEQEPYREPVGWLLCFRGIDTVTAITVVAEIHNFQRSESARGLMAYLGLTPASAAVRANGAWGASPRRATAMSVGSWLRRAGSTGTIRG
jgi:transposase